LAYACSFSWPGLHLTLKRAKKPKQNQNFETG
jgi:hypothetical protein